MIRFLLLVVIFYYSFRIFRKLLIGKRQAPRSNPFFSAFNQTQQRGKRIEEIEDAEYIEIQEDSTTKKE